MLDIIDRPELRKCTVTFDPGATLFLEGDETLDMYILVQGSFDVYKDDKKISSITEPGSLVGEMSFLLGEKRSATVKAGAAVKAIHIPGGEIEAFLREFPSLAPKITQTLAQRLRETTRVVHGLKEFCDQLPDAVITTDKDRNILAWNQAAERLHGRTWEQMQGHKLADVYQDPQEYQQFVDDINAGRSLTEKILCIKYPDEGEHCVSTSTTVLYDGHHNTEGFIFLSRDVTKAKQLERQYRRIKNWLIPAGILLVLLIIAIFYSLPYFSKGVRILDQRKASFTSRIVRDTQRLATALTQPLAAGDSQAIAGIFADYFKTNPEIYCITGLALLGRDKKVTHAFSPTVTGTAIGYSYSNIAFEGDQNSPYKLLTLFHADADHPMGRKGVEIAYAMQRGDDGEVNRWLLIQLETERLALDFGIDDKTLAKTRFEAIRP